MPCAPVQRDKLQNFPFAFDQEMRRDPDALDFAKIRMSVRVEPVEEKILNPRAAELFRWQADIVNYQQVHRGSFRPIITVW